MINLDKLKEQMAKSDELRAKYNDIAEQINSLMDEVSEEASNVATQLAAEGKTEIDLGISGDYKCKLVVNEEEEFKLDTDKIDGFMKFLEDVCLIDVGMLTKTMVLENPDEVIYTVRQSVPNISERLKDYCFVTKKYLGQIVGEPKE